MMDSLTARFEALLKNLGDIGVGINNVSVALGGYEMNIQNVVNVGGKLNQSFVALSRVTSLYGKTVNDLSSQTTALAQKFYLPYENLLSIQNKLASSLPVAITRQEQLNSVLSFAAERYGNTAQGVEGYIRVLEELSGKSQMLFEDQLLLIDAAENLRTAQQLGADAANNASDAYSRQASLTKENAQLMYLSGKIDRDTYASVVRSTQALDDQSKKMLQVAESGSRMTNEYKNAQTPLLQLIASSSQFNEFYRGLQVVPGMLAASAMTAIGDLGSKLFDGDKLNTEITDVRAAVNLFGQDLTAYMQKAAADGKSFDDAMQEVRADMEAAGGDAARLFDIYTQQADVLQSMQGIFQGNSDKAHKMAVIQAQLLKLEKDGNQEALRSLQLSIAKEAANDAEMKTLDARNLFLREAVKQAEAYNKQTTATIALMAQQESVLALLQDAGESIGGIEERRSAQVRATLDGMSAEYQLLTQIADQRKAIADASDRLRETSGEDRRIAAANKIASIDSAIATARANMDAAGDEAVRNQISKQLESLENERKINDELFKNGQYDKMAQASAEYRAEAANAELEKQQKYNRNIDAMRQIMVQVAQDQSKFASLRASEAQAELSLLDSVASGIGASADMRAKAAAEQGRVVEATRNEIASEKQLIKDLQSQIAIQEQLARQAEESGNQSAAAAAKQQIVMINAQIQKSELNITEARTKGMNALRTQLDITKQIREGYIDAISSMTEGAGVFAEIVVDQTKNLGVLLRTSKEMPTNLRTGSNTGPGAGISQFGAGGLMAGDFGPDIADYTNEIVSSQIPEIILSLDRIANRPVGDVASLNINRLAEAVEALGEGSTAIQGAANGGVPAWPTSASPPPSRLAPNNPAANTGAQTAPSSPAPQSSPAQQQTSANISAPVTAAAAAWGVKASQFLAQEEASRSSLMADLNRLATAQKVDFASLMDNMNKRLGAAEKGGEQSKIDEIIKQNAILVAEIKKLQETARKQLEQQKVKAAAEAEQPVTAGKQNQKELLAAAKPEPAAEKAAIAQEGGMAGRMDGILKQMADFSVAINSISDNLGKIGGGEKSAQEQIAALREMLGGGSPVVSMAKSIYDILVPFVGKNQEINVVLQPPEPSAVAVNMPGAVNLSDEAIGYLSLLPDFMENLREIASLLSAKSPAPIVQVEAPAVNSVGIRDTQADSMIALLSDLSKQSARTPSVPVELIREIGNLTSAKSPAPIVQVETPVVDYSGISSTQAESIIGILGKLSDQPSNVPVVPVELISEILKSVRNINESVAIKEKVSFSPKVEVSVEQPQNVAPSLDLSPLLIQVLDLQKLVASAEKSILTAARTDQPSPIVNFSLPEITVPSDMMDRFKVDTVATSSEAVSYLSLLPELTAYAGEISNSLRFAEIPSPINKIEAPKVDGLDILDIKFDKIIRLLAGIRNEPVNSPNDYLDLISEILKTVRHIDDVGTARAEGQSLSKIDISVQQSKDIVPAVDIVPIIAQIRDLNKIVASVGQSVSLFSEKDEPLSVVNVSTPDVVIPVDMFGATEASSANFSKEAIGFLSMIPALSEHVRQIASLAMVQPPAPIVNVESPDYRGSEGGAPKIENVVALLSDLSNQASKSSATPAEFIVDILKSVRHIDDVVAAKDKAYVSPKVEISVEQPRVDESTFDISPLVSQITNLQQLIASAEKSISSSAKMEQPNPIVNVSLPEITVPAEMVGGLGAGATETSKEAIGFLSLMPVLTEHVREIYDLLGVDIPSPIVKVETTEAKVTRISDPQTENIIAILSDIASSSSDSKVIPVEFIVDILKAVRHIDEAVAIKETMSAPANVEVSVEQPQNVSTPLDISPLIAQIRDLQQLVASVEKSLSASAKMEQPVPIVNVPSPELALPVEMLDSLAQIEGLIAEVRQVIYDQTSSQSTSLSNLFASFKLAEPTENEIGLAPAPVVNLDVAAPAPVPIDLTPVAQAIEKFPQFPVETIADAVVSLKNISASIPDKFAVSPTVSVTTPAITIPPVDAAPVAYSISQLANRMDISLADLAGKIDGIKPPDVDVAVSSPQVNIESSPPALIPVDMGDMDANLVLFGNKLVSQLDDVKLMIEYVRSAQDKSIAPQVEVDVPPPQVNMPANDFSPITSYLDSLTTSMNSFVGAMSAADQERIEAPRTEILPAVKVESPAVNVELAPEMLSSMVELLRAIKDSSSVPAVIQVPEVKPEVTVSVTPPNLSAVQTAVEAIPQMPVDMISSIMSTVVSIEKSMASIPSQEMGGKIDVSLKSDQPDYKPEFQKLIDKFNIDYSPVVGAINALSAKAQVQPQINVPPSEVVIDIPAAEPATAQVDVSSIVARLDDFKSSVMSMFSDLSSASRATAESMPKLSDFVPDVNVDSAPIQIPAIDLSGIQSASSRGSELVVASIDSAVNQFSQLQREMIAAIADNNISVYVDQKPVDMSSIDLSGIKESADGISSRIQGMTEELKATFSASISAMLGQVAEMPETKLLPLATAPQQKESAQVVPKIGEDFTSGVSALSEKIDKLVDKDMPSKFYDLMQKQVELLGGMSVSLASVNAVQVTAIPPEAVAAPQVEAAAVSPVAINISELVSEISRLNNDMYMSAVAGEQNLKESVGSLQADVSRRMAVISDLLLSISSGKVVGESSEAGTNMPSPTPIAPQTQGVQREDWSKIFPAIEVLQNNIVAALGGLGFSVSDSQKSVQNQQALKPAGEVSDFEKISIAEESRQTKLLRVLDGVSGAVNSLLESSKSSASASQDSFKGISAILKDILNAAKAVPQSNQGAAQQVAAAVDKAQKDNTKIGVQGERAASEATGESVTKKVAPAKPVQGESAVMSQGFVTNSLERAKTDASIQSLLANSKSKVEEIRTGFDSLNLEALGDKFDPSKADSSMTKDWDRAFSDLAMASGALELLMRSQGDRKTGDADSKVVSELVEMRNGLFSSLQQMQEAAKSGKIEVIDAKAVIRSVDLLSQKIVDQGTKTTAEKISPVEQAAKELDAIGKANMAFFDGVKTELSKTFKDKLNFSGMKYEGEGKKVVGAQLQQIFDQMGRYSASLDKYLSTVSVGEGDAVMQGKVDRVRQDFQNLIASLASGELKRESVNSGANFDLEFIKEKFANFQSDTFSELGIDFSKDFVPQLNDAIVKMLAPEGRSAPQNDQGAAVEVTLKQAGLFGAIPQIMTQLIKMQAAYQSGTEAVVNSVGKGAETSVAATEKASQDNVEVQQNSSAQASANSAQAAVRSTAAINSSEAQVRKSIEAASASEAAQNARISQEIEKSKQQVRAQKSEEDISKGLRDDARARSVQSSREAEVARSADRAKSPAGAVRVEKEMEMAVSVSQAKPLPIPNVQALRTPEEIEAIRATREQLKTQDSQREALEGMYRKITSSMVDMTLGGESREKIDAFQGLANQISSALKQNKSSMMTDESIETISRARRMSERAFAGLEDQFGALPVRGSSRSVVSGNPVREQEMTGVAVPNASRGGSAPASQQGSASANAIVTSVNFGDSISKQFADITRNQIVPEIMKGMAAGMHEAFSA